MDSLKKMDLANPLQKEARGKRQELFGSLNDTLLDSLEDATVLVDGEGRIAQANEAWRSITKGFPWLGSGENATTALDKAALKEASSEADAVLLGLHGVLQGTHPEFKQEFPVPRAGKTCWLRLRVKALGEDMAGFALLSLQDVTARWKAAQDLRESHSLFHRIIEEAGEGVLSTTWRAGS